MKVLDFLEEGWEVYKKRHKRYQETNTKYNDMMSQRQRLGEHEPYARYLGHQIPQLRIWLNKEYLYLINLNDTLRKLTDLKSSQSANKPRQTPQEL